MLQETFLANIPYHALTTTLPFVGALDLPCSDPLNPPIHALVRRVKEAMEIMRQRDALYSKRLDYQLSSATRRLQELVLECVGEYEKTRRRAVGRSQFLRTDCEEQMRQVEASLAWSRFAARLSEDWLGLVKAAHIDPRTAGNEAKDLVSTVAKALEEAGSVAAGSGPGVIRNMVKISPSPGGPRRRHGPPSAAGGAGGGSQVSAVCGDVVGLAGALWKAAGKLDRRMRRFVPRLASLKQQGSEGERLVALTTRAVEAEGREHGIFRNVPLETLLSSAGIRWLLARDGAMTGSRFLEPVNSRIYYCIEERAQGRGRDVGAVPTKAEAHRANCLALYLESMYVDQDGLPKLGPGGLSSALPRVVRAQPAHRRVNIQAVRGFFQECDLVGGFPDVLEVRYWSVKEWGAGVG